MTVRTLVRGAAASGVLAAALCTASASPAAAHSPTDFLKVPVGHPATVLLPPITGATGRLEITLATPVGFHLIGASAGRGWRERLASHAAVLDGRGTGGPVLLTVRGTAARPGQLPLDVRVTSPTAPGQTFRWTLTALAGYTRPASSLAGAAPPDAPVATATATGAARPMWPVSAALGIAALTVLSVRRRRGRQDVTWPSRVDVAVESAGYASASETRRSKTER